MGHAVPERQRDVAKIADVGRFASNQKGIRHGREKISAVTLLHQPQCRQAIEDNARRARIGARQPRNFVSRMTAVMNQGEKIIFDGSVEDLPIGEIPEDPHQRPRRELSDTGFIGHGCRFLPPGYSQTTLEILTWTPKQNPPSSAFAKGGKRGISKVMRISNVFVYTL